ncbi:hypothetical protein BBK36DRAFT_1135663 [Trichoderma citrinoviride]|uniref:DUF4604 domain-containing protein n=1 Tax=Trichoderma citrinoviride TaxID=58853 RepID=A0A2T4B6W2_9HYPO|nr:hypothetical protein BBK36DRAFT_1135663 [Trichoderma citrinoviride]PTB65076.1 hypothetical protein BBK36DRAFT_1135663 [Trichoderma citrinoviride]
MSQKINAKNLSYNSSLPPFLAALRAQASGATGPDPILSAQRRGGKKRSSSEEAEDAPLVVDEHGNALEDLKVNKDGTVEESAAAANAEDAEEAATKDGAEKSEAEPARASMIGGRKRKVGKVVGEEAQDDGSETAPAGKKNETAKKNADDAEQATNRKPKKKTKKIKLSFDEDEG